jgi:hypothetical protein
MAEQSSGRHCVPTALSSLSSHRVHHHLRLVMIHVWHELATRVHLPCRREPPPPPSSRCRDRSRASPDHHLLSLTRLLAPTPVGLAAVAPAHLPWSPSHRSAATTGTTPMEPPAHVVSRPHTTLAQTASAYCPCLTALVLPHHFTTAVDDLTGWRSAGRHSLPASPVSGAGGRRRRLAPSLYLSVCVSDEWA